MNLKNKKKKILYTIKVILKIIEKKFSETDF